MPGCDRACPETRGPLRRGRRRLPPTACRPAAAAPRPAAATVRLAILLVIGSAATSRAGDGSRSGQEASWPASERTEQALGDSGAPLLELRSPSDPRLNGPGLGLDPETRAGVGLRRGVLLGPYLRLALYGRNVPRRARDPQRIAELAAAELWVVVFPYARERARALLGQRSRWTADPREPLGRTTVPGAETLWPETVELVTTAGPRRVIEPLWVRRDDLPFSAGLTREWVRRRSLVAAFPLADPAVAERAVRLTVDYRVEQGSTPSDSFRFDLSRIGAGAWAAALAGD